VNFATIHKIGEMPPPQIGIVANALLPIGAAAAHLGKPWMYAPPPPSVLFRRHDSSAIIIGRAVSPALFGTAAKNRR
jgi:hypothetical protein